MESFTPGCFWAFNSLLPWNGIRDVTSASGILQPGVPGNTLYEALIYAKLHHKQRAREGISKLRKSGHTCLGARLPKNFQFHRP